MQAQSSGGRISLNYAGRRYSADYQVSAGVLTVQSRLGSAAVMLPDPELASASAARTLLRQIVSRSDAARAQGGARR